MPGGLEPADSPIPAEPPPDIPKRKRRLPSMTLPAATVLTKAEVKDLRPRLVDALLATWPRIDWGITKTNKAKADAYIWRTIDQDDSAVIADALLRLGMRYTRVAMLCRGVAITSENASATMIIGQRLIATWLHYIRNGGIG